MKLKTTLSLLLFFFLSTSLVSAGVCRYKKVTKKCRIKTPIVAKKCLGKHIKQSRKKCWHKTMTSCIAHVKHHKKKCKIHKMKRLRMHCEATWKRNHKLCKDKKNLLKAKGYKVFYQACVSKRMKKFSKACERKKVPGTKTCTTQGKEQCHIKVINKGKLVCRTSLSSGRLGVFCASSHRVGLKKQKCPNGWKSCGRSHKKLFGHYVRCYKPHCYEFVECKKRKYCNTVGRKTQRICSCKQVKTSCGKCTPKENKYRKRKKVCKNDYSHCLAIRLGQETKGRSVFGTLDLTGLSYCKPKGKKCWYVYLD